MKDKDKKALSYINRVLGNTRIHILTLMLVQIILGMSSILYALLFRNVIDYAVSRNREEMIRNILFLILLIAVQIALRAVVRFLQEYSRAGYENAFKKRLYETLLSKDYGSVSEVHSGEWVNRLTSDTAVIAEGMSTILPGLGEMLARMIGAAIMILVIEPLFWVILIPGGLLLVVLTYIFRKRLKSLHKKVQEADGIVRVFLQEHLESLMIIKSYSVEEEDVEQASYRMDRHKKARIRKNHFSNICNVGFASAMNGAYLLGIVYGAFGILNGTVSYGTLIALIQLIGQIQSPFANITGYLPKYYAMIASAERLMEAEEFPEDGEAGVCTGPAGSDRADIEYVGSGFLEFGLNGASFSYTNGEKGETHVFDNYDLSVKNGEYVAFTGESGCGKSTVLKILMSLYPLSSGERYINTEQGRFTLDVSYRKLFAYVPQGNYLMSGSIRDIVTFAKENEEKKDARGEELSVGEALDIACASEFIEELPEGLDTILGEKGAGLSEGQMQRIAIARAVYSDRPVLLLDEATSALDGQTEERLLKNLKSMTDKTVIIVTHRPAALSVCDRQVHFL